MVTPRWGDTSSRRNEGATMHPADWYFAQADVYRERADACLQLANQLDGAALFDLHSYSGEATWQCPAALEFDEQLAAHCTRLSDAIARLRSNALGLSGEADDLDTSGARCAAPRNEATARTRRRGAGRRCRHGRATSTADRVAQPGAPPRVGRSRPSACGRCTASPSSAGPRARSPAASPGA